MAYVEISIGALERGVRSLARKLETMKLQTEVEVFKTGPGGAQHYGPSNVELTVKGTYIDTDGHEEEAWTTVKFIAGGYGDLHGQRGEFGGTEGWKAMRDQGFAYIMSSLKSQGWHSESTKNPTKAFDELHVFLADTVSPDVDHEIVSIVGRAPDATIVAPGSLSPVPGRVLIFGGLSEAHRFADAILNRFKRALGATNVRVFTGYGGGGKRWGAYAKRRAKYLGGRPVYVPTQRFTKIAKNPTPRGSLVVHQNWPFYELKYMNANVRRDQQRRIDTCVAWHGDWVLLLRQELPNKPAEIVCMEAFRDDRPPGQECAEEKAREEAIKLAIKWSRQDPANPNPIRVINDDGECVFAMLAGKEIECPQPNPWTPPGALWPRYELKVEPHESYMHQGKRIIVKWRVTLRIFDPDSPRPIDSEVGYARDPGSAEQVAVDYAKKLRDKEPRNPNDIRVFDPNGKCVWSLHGSC